MSERIVAPWIVTIVAVAVLSSGCSPKVQVTAPTEPITNNLNVKIEHEISVKVDKDLEQLFEEDDELF